jgi:hypothetical protein
MRAMPNMVSYADKNLVIAVHTSVAPSREEWAAWMKLVNAVNTDDLRLLVFSDGGGPEAGQRGEFVEVVKRGRPLIAVMTSAVKARAAVTAVSWFVPTIKHFAVSAEGFDGAAKHLGLPDDVATRMRAKVRMLCTKLTGGVPASLPAAW